MNEKWIDTHEYLGLKKSVHKPFGVQKYIAYYVKAKHGDKHFKVERVNEETGHTSHSVKTLKQLKALIRGLDKKTDKGMAYLEKRERSRKTPAFEETDMRYKKGDLVKIKVPFEGFGQYGIRKGSIGRVVRHSTFRGEPALQVDFPKAGKELSMFPSDIEKVTKKSTHPRLKKKSWHKSRGHSGSGRGYGH